MNWEKFWMSYDVMTHLCLKQEEFSVKWLDETIPNSLNSVPEVMDQLWPSSVKVQVFT